MCESLKDSNALKYTLKPCPLPDCPGVQYSVHHLSVHDLLPATSYYMTYEGSTTMPACHETVTWVLLNKPIYITKQQVSQSVKGEEESYYFAPRPTYLHFL